MAIVLSYRNQILLHNKKPIQTVKKATSRFGNGLAALGPEQVAIIGERKDSALFHRILTDGMRPSVKAELYVGHDSKHTNVLREYTKNRVKFDSANSKNYKKVASLK